MAEEKKVTRRGFLTAAVSAVVAGVVAGVGGYYAGLGAAGPAATTTVTVPGPTTTVTRTTTVTAPPVTTTVTTTVGAPPVGPKEILIGASLALTGPMAPFDAGITFGHKAAVEDINKLGGVYVRQYGRRIPVRYIVYNNETEPAKAASLAAKLILEDGVIALVGGDGPPVTWNPICAQAERYQTPIVAGSPWEPWWAGGPYKYAWSILFRIATKPGVATGHPWLEGRVGYCLTDVALAITDKYADKTNRRVAVLAADDADGRGWYEAFPNVLKEAGYTPWRTPPHTGEKLGLYPPGTTDFTGIIRAWKEADCQIMWANLPGADFGIVVKQMAGLGYTPKLGWIARGAMFYEDIMAWGGDLPEGWISEIKWDPRFPPEICRGIGDTTPMSLFERWTKEKGTPPVYQHTYTIGMGYSAMQVLLDAIERADKLDKESINEAIAETAGYFMSGHIRFSKTAHDSPNPIMCGQWQKVDKPWKWEMKIVFSQHPWMQPDADMIFPIPSKG